MALSLLRDLPPAVTVVEVGPRDGLQNEKAPVPTEAKVHFIDLLSQTGLPVIEATSFVSPRAVPQLADAGEVFSAITQAPGVRYPVLVPNPKGLERALAAGVREVAVFTAASESFTRHNINATIAESLANFAAIAAEALPAGVRLRGYVSTAFGCPYEGDVPREKVREVTARLFDLGVAEVSIGDTIGVATPAGMESVMGLLLRDFPAGQLALHLHDTRGTALANVFAALQMGLTIFDSAAGGLGGCPYAPGASGNLATEDLLYLLDGLGIQTGVDLGKVVAASAYLASVRGQAPASKYFAAARTATA
ncbi:MAG TPA: hydroxymethylglutaryl-CoA lyase [Chloroflexia bacterium]|nr:hydroxymethylglutaryl-CoA lyase [Chloroflexia bacterium]